jgi:hypothetical protein
MRVDIYGVSRDVRHPSKFAKKKPKQGARTNQKLDINDRKESDHRTKKEVEGSNVSSSSTQKQQLEANTSNFKRKPKTIN